MAGSRPVGGSADSFSGVQVNLSGSICMSDVRRAVKSRRPLVIALRCVQNRPGNRALGPLLATILRGLEMRFWRLLPPGLGLQACVVNVRVKYFVRLRTPEIEGLKAAGETLVEADS